MRSFPPGCIALLFLLFLLILLPFFLADLFMSALAKLGLDPGQSLIVLMGIFIGSMFNIPIRRVTREAAGDAVQGGMYGFNNPFFSPAAQPDKVLLAVNFGGCIVPLLLGGYQVTRLLALNDSELLIAAGIAVVVNILVCERLAKPIPNKGLAIPALVPALTAAICALILAPGQAPAVAYLSGVMGPLVGADLMHLREIKQLGTGIASIGGAGTFDGIVLSGIVATLLA